MMKIEIKQVMRNIYVLAFESQFDLAMTFVRIQEFYESPKYKGKYFSLEEFMDWYSCEFGNGAFTYPKDWSGFNLPGKTIKKWVKKFQVEHNDIREQEHELLNKLESRLKDDGVSLSDAYVIGVHSQKNDEELKYVIEHETAHALYCLYPQYKQTCQKLLKNLPRSILNKYRKKLIRVGYAKNVLSDEIQAYFSTEGDFVSEINEKNEFENHFIIFKEKLKKGLSNFSKDV